MLDFIHAFPRALVEVDIDTTPSLIDRLDRGDLDVVLVARGYPDKTGRDCVLHPSVEFKDLCSLKFDFVVRADHPVTARNARQEDIFEYPLACPKAPTDILTLVASAQKQASAPYPCPNILIDDYDAVFKIVDASDHWTAAPTASRAAIERNPKLKVIPGADIIPPLNIGYAYRKQWTPVPSADHFLSLIQTAVQKLPPGSISTA